MTLTLWLHFCNRGGSTSWVVKRKDFIIKEKKVFKVDAVAAAICWICFQSRRGIERTIFPDGVFVSRTAGSAPAILWQVDE